MCKGSSDLNFVVIIAFLFFFFYSTGEDTNIFPTPSLMAFLFGSSPQLTLNCAGHRTDAFRAEQRSPGLLWKRRREKKSLLPIRGELADG